MSFIHESLYKNSDLLDRFLRLPRATDTKPYPQLFKFDNRSELITKLDDVHINLKQAIPCG